MNSYDVVFSKKIVKIFKSKISKTLNVNKSIDRTYILNVLRNLKGK